MLSEEQNRQLTEVGAGTPMGELLRRYWMPIAAVAELEDRPSKPVRLLGEDLVLFKDKEFVTGKLTMSADQPVPEKDVFLVKVDGKDFTFVKQFQPKYVPAP